MKKILLLTLILCGLNVRSQITYEQTYDSAATWNFCSGEASQLLIVKFEISGERYVKINKCGKNMKIYDLSHNLLKTISLAGVPNNGPPDYSIGSVLYLSEKLFNTDSKMEFMCTMISPTMSTSIYNEDGVLLFNEPGAPLVLVNVHQIQYPIYNTSLGTKMILSYMDGKAKVFNLGGTLSIGIQSPNGNAFDPSSFAVSNPIPNPSINQTRINYVLPKDIEEGELVLYDMQGKEIKRYRVDNTFNNIIVSTHDVQAGTYFYQLQISGRNSEAKKMIVIK